MRVSFCPFAAHPSPEFGRIPLVKLRRLQWIVCSRIYQAEKLADNLCIVLVEFLDFFIDDVSAVHGASCDLPVGQLFMP
jgi:hypothetical protein